MSHSTMGIDIVLPEWSSLGRISRNTITFGFNSLWPSDAIWGHRALLILAQVMIYCLMAPNYYLNRCWVLISIVLWHSSENIIIERPEDTSYENKIENCISKSCSHLPRDNELIDSYRWADEAHVINNTKGLVQERRNSSAVVMGLRLSCTYPLIHTVAFVVLLKPTYPILFLFHVYCTLVLNIK